MQPTTKTVDTPVHAYTDLYDEVERNFLYRYPAWALTALSFTGVAAFALAGFVPTGIRIFPPSGPLFLWLCAVIISLQVAVLRNPALRVHRLATLIVDAIAILIVIIAYFTPGRLTGSQFSFITDIKAATQQLPMLAIINFGLILIFLADSVRRWISRARGQSIVPRVSLGIGAPARELNDTELGPEPTLLELISGDLIAAGVFIIIFAFLFTPVVANTVLSGALPYSPVHADCTFTANAVVPCTRLGVAYPGEAGLLDPNGYAATGLFNDPRLLSLVDLVAALLLLICGLLILAPAALGSGLGTPIDPETTSPNLAGGEVNTASTGTISKEVSKQVLDTLGAGLNRRFRFSFTIALRDLALRFRHVVWPLLILAGIAGASILAQEVANYLHTVTAAPQCYALTSFYTCPGSQVANVGQSFIYAGKGVVAGVVIVAGILLSLAALLFSWRVASNSFRYLLLVGFILALTLWIFSLVLSVVNVLYWIFSPGNTAPDAFPQPSLVMSLSLLVFLRYAIPWLISRARANRTGAPVPPMVDIGAITGGRRPAKKQPTPTA